MSKWAENEKAEIIIQRRKEAKIRCGSVTLTTAPRGFLVGSSPDKQMHTRPPQCTRSIISFQVGDP